MKQFIFYDHTSKALKSWHDQHVKKKDKSFKSKTLGYSNQPQIASLIKTKSSDTVTMVSSRPSANNVSSVDIPDDKT